MDDSGFETLCARVNANLDVSAFIEVLNYRPDAAIKFRNLWRLYCPVHKDPLFRTLVLNPRRNTCHCEFSGCSVHRTSNLIELLAATYEISRVEAVLRLVDAIGPQALRLTEAEVEALRGRPEDTL